MITIEGARAPGLEDEFGSLEEGNRADFSLVDLARLPVQPVFIRPLRQYCAHPGHSARGTGFRW